jgi:hypothetical protein
MGNNAEVVLSKETWKNGEETDGVNEVLAEYWTSGGQHLSKDWMDHSGHGRAIGMILGGGVMKDIADRTENDRGVLVDLYIPRHCSATS